jgi:hypothetical protein
MVNIDKVYQKVLAFANKEQRGYMYPQEFNLFADQAQMEIFEQYFYDKNQFARIPGNSYAYSDMIDNLEEKIQIFECYNKPLTVSQATHNPNNNPAAAIAGSWGDIRLGDQYPDIYRIGTVLVKYHTEDYGAVAERFPIKEIHEYAYGKLTRPTRLSPRYTEYPASDGTHKIKIYPYPHHDRDVDRVQISYIRKPKKPHWAYVVVNHKPLYNSTDSAHFELHASEESELVYRILAYAGIALEKPGLTQAAVGLETTKQQQEKI